MAESPESLYARIHTDLGPGGRLPVTPAAAWDVFPWEVEGGRLVTKVLAPPTAEEAPREGDDGGKPCGTCAGERDDRLVWEDDAWTLRVMPRGGLPLVMMLEPKEHLDYTDLSEEQAAALGVLSVRVTRIIERLDNVGRVHVQRIGDGARHLHVWLIGRPARFGQILGSFAIEWDDMLPPTPEEEWLADQRTVAAEMALHSGRALVVG